MTIHKRRIVASIKREEKKRETHPPRDRVVSFRRSRLRVRWDRPLPWEASIEAIEDASRAGG
jgi:hypothetical protein